MKFSRSPWLLLLFALSLLPTPWLRADTLTGEVRGAVLDVDGAVPLANVRMILLNVDRGWSREQQTDALGNFAFLQLEPGNYTVSADYQGYYPQEKTGVLIRLNQPKIVLPPFQLRKEVPTPTQQITLQGEQTRTAIIDLTAPGPNPVVLAYLSEPGDTSLLTLGDAAIRANYDASLLATLPLRGGRTFDQLALLSPGVFRVPFSSGQGPAVGIGVGTAGQFSVNGQRGRSNNFTVDGSDNNDEDIGVRRQGFVSLVPQNTESVQEFQVVTSGFPAEFGRNSGSMVNAVSRSGQSRAHGQIYGIFNHHALNARNFFDDPFEDRVNQGDLEGGRFRDDDYEQLLVGGVLGAPIVQDELFFFGSLERQENSSRRLGHFVVPAASERGLRRRAGFVPIEELGDFYRERGIRALRFGQLPVLYSSLAGEGVFSLYPLPNNPSGPFADHTYSQVQESRQEGTIFSLKFDWYPWKAHSLTARYNFTDDDSRLPFTSEAFDSALGTDARTQNLSIFLNSNSPTHGNALRFSYGRTNLSFPPGRGSPLIFGSPALLPVPPQFANAPNFGRAIDTPYGRFGPFGTTGPIGQLTIAPFSTRGIDVFNFPQGRVSNTFQLSDFVTWSGQRHTLKFGFDFRRSQLNSFSDRNARPQVFFGFGEINQSCIGNPTCPLDLEGGFLRGTDLASLGAPSGFLQAISGREIADSTIGLNISQYDFFVQDDWKLAPNLTLNLGLRYELQPPPSERNRRIEDALQIRLDQFSQLAPAAGSPRCDAILADTAMDATLEEATICRANAAFALALDGLQGFLQGRDRIYDEQKTDLAPRLGLAWDPGGNGRMVVRAGYGIAYDSFLGAVTSQSRNVFPTFVPLNLDPNFAPTAGLFLPHATFFTFLPTNEPLIVPGSLNVLNLRGDRLTTGIGALFNQSSTSLHANGLAFTLPERNLQRSSAQYWLLSLQRQWGADWLTSLDYVGTQGRHLTRFATPNGGLITTPLVVYSVGLQGIVLADRPPSIPFEAAERPLEGLGAFRLFENSANSSFHSLQLAVERRFSRGFEFRANWTWAHAIDQVSDPFDGRGFFSLPQDSRNLFLERASASFDARHRVSFHFIWELPGQSLPAPFRNWRLAGIGEFQTGQPFTVNTARDRNGDGNLTDRIDSVAGLVLQPDTAQPVQLQAGTEPLSLLAPRGLPGRVGRNSFRADGLSTVDLALFRSFRLGETLAVDFRAELFNLFNTTSFGIPVRILESPGFGNAFDTQTDPRSLRLAVKLRF